MTWFTLVLQAEIRLCSTVALPGAPDPLEVKELLRIRDDQPGEKTVVCIFRYGVR